VTPDSVWTEFKLALIFLTRLPLRLTQAPPLAAAMWSFPLAGAVIGLAVGVIYGAAHRLLPPMAAALLAIAGGICLTGALHEDGLADCADGFGGGRDREAKLRIMKDSAIGSFGALALIVTVMLRASLLAELQQSSAVLMAAIASHAVSRALLPLTMRLLPPAGPGGIAAAAGTPSAAVCVVALGLALVILMVALPHDGAVAALLTALAAAGAFAWLAQRQIGGYSGDVLGATQQLGEIAALLAIVVVKGPLP
jgi:adenosylcobinamide-GDP ribazoletransferase